MKPRDLRAGAEVQRVNGDADVEMTGLSYDSRRVNRGDLFFSTARDLNQNRANGDEALNRGASAVVVKDGDGVAARTAVTIVECGRPRLVMGVAASHFFNAPSRQMDLIGVTGTSGKTTTTYLLASIFEAAGIPCRIIGTIGTLAGSPKLYRCLPTPDADDF